MSLIGQGRELGEGLLVSGQVLEYSLRLELVELLLRLLLLSEKLLLLLLLLLLEDGQVDVQADAWIAK